MGAKNDRAFQEAYWRSFERVFGPQNSRMVKSMLLTKVKTADTGDSTIDRVCFGLRTTMGWLADAIERMALREAGFEVPGSSEDPGASQQESKKVAPA